MFHDGISTADTNTEYPTVSRSELLSRLRGSWFIDEKPEINSIDIHRTNIITYLKALEDLLKLDRMSLLQYLFGFENYKYHFDHLTYSHLLKEYREKRLRIKVGYKETEEDSVLAYQEEKIKLVISYIKNFRSSLRIMSEMNNFGHGITQIPSTDIILRWLEYSLYRRSASDCPALKMYHKERMLNFLNKFNDFINN